MTRSTLPLSLLLVLMLAAAALAQSTEYSVPAGNVIDDRISDEPLKQGQVRFKLYPGYRDELHDQAYAFPISNAALGRAWATGSDLKWQVANDYSVVPVRVILEHRYAYAQQVRVEIYSTHPYAREELQNLAADSPEALSRQLAMFSKEMLVPPSVPTSFMITPRYIPQVPPGHPINLQVLVYFNEQLTINQELDVVVMEPAHLYYLHLDEALAETDELEINADNSLELGFSRRMQFDPSVLSTILYGLPVDRQVFTGAPLASRNFAFACVDMRRTRDWPPEEQQALESFMLAGGRLCMYNMDGPWRKFDNVTDSAVGRGFLLAETGDYSAAKQKMQQWVSGELEEFVLLSGGSVQGYSVPGQAGNSVFGNFGLELEQVYGRDELTNTLPSMRPGFLHPVWLYRELCSEGSVEPWDFPEYQLRRPRSSGQLTNQLALETVVDSRVQDERALLDSAVPPRSMPLGLLLVLGLTVPGMLLLVRLRRRLLAPACIVLFAAVLGLWGTSRPLDFRPVRLQLLDRDPRVETVSSRRLNVLLSDSRGRSRLQMPPDALIRRVAWFPPGSFSQQSDRSSSMLSGQGAAESVNVYVDAISTDPPEFPVSVELDRQPGRTRLLLDTSRLRAGQSCVLQTPLGFELIEQAAEPVAVIVSHPQLPVQPGLGRIRVIREMHEGGPGQGNPNIARFGTMLSSLREEVRRRQGGSLAQICWEGMLRQPYGLIGANQSQVVIIVVDEQPVATGEGVQELTVQRMCLPLGGAG